MKYRELTPEEIKIYQLGYRVGNHQTVITDIEWTEEEKAIYRKGYLAGAKAFNRTGKPTEPIVSTMSTMSTMSTPRTSNTVYNNNYNTETENSNKGVIGGKEKGENNFTPPKNAEEVYEYAQVSGIICPKEEAQNFYDYYSGIGWCLPNDSKTPMKDWHPFWRKWLRNPLRQQPAKQTPRMSLKEMKEAENHMKLQKMLNGEL